MISRPSKILYRLVLVVLAFSFLACRFTVQTPTATNTPIPSATLQVVVATPVIQSTLKPTYTAPTATSELAVTLTPTLPLVTITAINGNIYIRRGSGSDFNPIATLFQGQTATVLGRDILDQWLYIPIPSQTGKFGWVSTLTIYSSVSGHTMNLPVVDSGLAVPAFIQNCSIHNMIVQPVGLIIPPGNQFPNNIVRFDPGLYTIQDYDTGKSNLNSNQGIAVDLREGELYKLTAMGTSAQHKCPDGQ
ncbi:MAG TPA: SH3 domain-containing protein [Anaerolineales bacterium]